MIGFLIKKAFFDAWDNLIGLVVSNLGYVVILVLFSLDIGKFLGMELFNYVIIILALLLFSFHNVGVAKITFAYSNYKRDGFEGYRDGIRLYWRHALGLFVINVIVTVLVFLVIPFYFALGNIVGLAICVILSWVLLTFFLSIQYFTPLMVNFSGDKPLKTLKKCLIMAMGNLGTSFFLLFYNIIQIGLSVVTAGLLFSGTGINLVNMDAFKLLLLRIDYIEEHEDISVKEIPWDEILYEERESVGNRTLKGMIFPWKD